MRVKLQVLGSNGYVYLSQGVVFSSYCIKDVKKGLKLISVLATSILYVMSMKNFATNLCNFMYKI